MNENLTPENHHIFLQAHRLKKDGLISAAFTNRGLVYIRRLGNDEPICINEINILKELFPIQRSDGGSGNSTHDNTFHESLQPF